MLDIIIIISQAFLLLMTEVSSLRYFANVFVGLLFKSNVYMYFGMKTIWIDWTILFVSEKGVGNLCCQFSQRNIGFQTQRSSRASLKGMSFPVLFIDLKSSFFFFFFMSFFTCIWTMFTCCLHVHEENEGERSKSRTSLLVQKVLEVKIAELRIY